MGMDQNTTSKPNTERSVHIDVWLTEREYEMLLLMSGFVTSMGEKEYGPKLRWKFIHIVNRLYEKLLGFTPYVIPPEYAWNDEDDIRDYLKIIEINVPKGSVN